jgi:hypothetical protein
MLLAALAALSLAVTLAVPAGAATAMPVKVAIIVGPVADLTPTYINLAEQAAAAAEWHGATVSRAYSPVATPANVLAAVADAKIVIYFGHGYGHPSPYGGLNTARQNGWGLQGPNARGDHADSSGSGRLAYYGEDWIVANARPAPGFVMIYSNVCYAPGASEGGHPDATALQAAERVSGYSRAVFAMGGSAYFATDFDHGAADIVDRILRDRRATYGNLFATDAGFQGAALTTQPHWFSAGQQVWLHRSHYAGKLNYWYAFAGDPGATPIRSWDPVAPSAQLVTPAVEADAMADAPMTLRFSEPVGGVTAGSARLLDADGNPVAATLSLDAAGTTLTMSPAVPLAMSSHYRISLGSGIADLGGNPLPESAWAFRTRRDADPFDGPLPVVLAAGGHELVRFGPDGVIADRLAVDLTTDRGFGAIERARVDGQRGSWFLLGSGELRGWWIRESARAHAPGVIETVRLGSGATVSLPAGSHALAAQAAVAGQPVATLRLAADAVVSVDRSTVIDGVTWVRLVDESAGRGWLPLAPGLALTVDRSAVVRLLSSEPTDEEMTLALASGAHMLFRLDALGRVIERRVVSLDAPRGFEVQARGNVGGRSLLRFGRGEHGGWWIAESDAARVVVSTTNTSAD